MKRYIIFILLTLMLHTMCHCSAHHIMKAVVPANQFLIQGKLTNVPDGVIIGLFKNEGRMFSSILKDTLVNGTFSLQDTVSSPRKLLIMCHDKGFPGVWLEVWVAPGKTIKVSGEDKLLKTWHVESDIPEQAEENRFMSCAMDMQRELMKHLVAEYDWLREMFPAGGSASEDFVKKGWVKVDSIRKVRDPLEKEIWKKELEYMKTAPISQVWMDKLLSFASMIKYKETMPYGAEVKELYATRLPEAQKQTDIGREITQYVFPPAVVGVGDEMVDGNLYDREGKLHHLSEFKGRYILLDFWSRGCGPCIQSIPEMEEITDLYKDKMTVVSISEDPKQLWIDFITEKKMNGNQWNELRNGRTGLAAAYQVNGIPFYVLINPEGKIQKVWGGYGQGSLLREMKQVFSPPFSMHR